jgi:hypothetical protein
MISQSPAKSSKKGLWWLLVLAGIVGLAYWKQQAALDWYKLRGYTPSSRVSQMATTDDMTDYGRHLFYVNKPEFLPTRAAFAAKCPVDMEKTIVLGCYLRGDDGIFLYDVTDQRLHGVVETTAAHEMLHAAYERLSYREKRHIESLLMDFARTKLQDKRIKDTLTAYQKAKADMGNEMHSIFATEVATLTPELETYYQRYFTDRRKVIAEMTRYQNEFTSRETKVAEYDVQLKQLKTEVEASNTSLEAQLSQLDGMQNQMNAYESAGNYRSYNAMVSSYNYAVDRYNADLENARGLVDRYNQMVEARNALATEEQSLVKSLSGDALPSKKW